MSQSKRLTAQFAAQKRLREKQDVISLLLQEHEDNSSAWIWESDAKGMLTRVPEQLSELLFGKDASSRGMFSIFELAERDISDTSVDLKAVIEKHLADKRAFHDLQFEIWAADAASTEETTRWISVRGKPYMDANGNLIGYRGIVSDITEAKIAEDKIRFMAGHDPLTKLANRITFGEGLQPWIDSKQPFATLHLDLDRFKLVNDTLGHLAGDELLVAVAERLKIIAANHCSEAIVARIGGDEFVIALPISMEENGKKADVSLAETTAARIVSELAIPFKLEAGSATIGASVGYVVYPDDCEKPSDMPSRADLALYRAKNDGRGKWARYTHDMDRRAHNRRLLEIGLQSARKAGQMKVVYQPVVDLENGTVSGVEALMRWDHPNLGAIGPDEFIPIAEESGAIVALGEWVLEQACLEAASWERPLTVAVNVSAKQILRGDFVTMVLDTLAKTKLAPGRLELELTESILVQDADAALRAIRSLRKLGISVVLDDFGTGYSSLSYLRDFAFDKIKIDKSFISSLGDERSDDAQEATTLVTAIVNLAQTLGMRTTAEGIELESQADDLREMGCNIGQGYLFARPVSSEQLKAILGMTTVTTEERKIA